VQFYTRKKTILDAGGSICFVIEGSGKRDKTYLLRSFVFLTGAREEAHLSEGIGQQPPESKILNNEDGFDEFKHYCGNFGLGFLEITKSKFHKKLLKLARLKK